MKRRQWKSQKNALIVLSGLKGQSMASICNEHGISQSQYYQWKDQFLVNSAKAFDVEKQESGNTLGMRKSKTQRACGRTDSGIKKKRGMA